MIWFWKERHTAWRLLNSYEIAPTMVGARGSSLPARRVRYRQERNSHRRICCRRKHGPTLVDLALSSDAAALAQVRGRRSPCSPAPMRLIFSML